MITTVNSSAALTAALKSAHAGDTILLASGTYSAMSLAGFNFTGTVTVQSADSAHQAVINGLTVNNSSGLSFNHLEFVANGSNGATVLNSHDITFDTIKVHGVAVGSGDAMLIRDSSAVTVTNSDFGTLNTGINEVSTKGLVVSNNTFHGIGNGAIRGSGDTQETISGNHFLDAKASLADHSDVIQLWQNNVANQVSITATNTYGATPVTTPPVTTPPVTTPPVTTPPVTTPPVTSQPSSPASAPSGSVTVASTQALITALKAAHAGDTILLAPGTYNGASLTGINFTGTVTIQSADNAHQAVINSLSVTNSSGLSFNHVDFAANGATAASVQSSHNITFDTDTFHDTAIGVGNGMLIRDSNAVTVTNSDVGKLDTGINEVSTSGLTLSNNTFHDIRQGAIRGAGDTQETISGNHFLDGKASLADHSDVIQLWQDNVANHVNITATNTYGATSATTPPVTTPPVTTPPITTPPVTTPPVTTPPVTIPSSGTGAAPSGSITVTNATDLMTALKTAHAGDTINLAAGNYGALTLNNLHFDGTVTIKSASTSSEAVVSGISLNGSSGLAFANLDVSVPNGGTGVYAANTSNLAFSGLSVHGVGVGGTGNGFFIRDSSGVTINGSDITNVVSGIGHYNSDDLTISNNNLHGLQTDGIYGGGSSHVVVSGNHITDFTPNPGDHPDAIQFWAGPNGAPGTDITVSDNVISRGSGAVMQGVFVENTQNITITGNAMVGTMGNGISLSTTTNGLVENNYVQGYSDMNSWITTRGTSANVTVVHNTSQAVVNYQDGGAPNPNYFDGDNTVIGAAPVGDQTAANAWLAQHVSLSPTGSSAGDVLAGGAGDDTLNGLAGADTMSGGFGDDTYVVDNAADVIVENLNAGVDTVRTSLATYTLSSNVEKLVLTGSSAQSGMGNSLNNTLTSNAVGATLNGGAGNDVLVSAGGADTLTGGTGADTFYFQKAPATVAQITDFTSGQDKLDLHTLLQAYHGTDPLADHWVKFQSDASGTTVMVDLDGPTGSAGFVAVAKLAGVTSLTSTDWVFH